MGILDKLRKEKKSESVLDSLIKKKEPQEETKGIKKAEDIEVRELNPAEAEKVVAPEDAGIQPVQEKTIHEFRTEGMHEFELDSLGTSTDAGLKAGYKSQVARLIDENKIDEAIRALQELKQKLTKEK